MSWKTVVSSGVTGGMFVTGKEEVTSTFVRGTLGGGDETTSTEVVESATTGMGKFVTTRSFVGRGTGGVVLSKVEFVTTKGDTATIFVSTEGLIMTVFDSGLTGMIGEFVAREGLPLL